MATRLTPLAELRSPGDFSWDGDTYPNTKRGLKPDAEALAGHAKPLEKMLSLAPTGYPSHSNLRTALLILQRKFQILSDATQGALDRCTDQWKIMMKDVAVLAKAGVEVPPLLQSSVDIVTLASSPTATGLVAAATDQAQPVPAQALQFPDMEGLDDELSSGLESQCTEDDCEFQGVLVCNCGMPECPHQQKQVILVPSDGMLSAGW